MFGLHLLSGLDLRRIFRSSPLRSRRRTGYRPDVASEVLRLEPRWPLSNTNPVILTAFGYKWDANYHGNVDTGDYSDGQLWSPLNASNAGGVLKLTITPTTLDDGRRSTISADVALVGRAHAKKPFPLSYGTYLVSAETSGSFGQLSNTNAIFGAFTYQNLQGNGKFDGRMITGLPKSLVEKLKPGYFVDAINYAGAPLVPAKNTKIERIVGDTVFIDQDPINNPGTSDHAIYFTDNRLTNAHRELDMIETINRAPENNAQFTLQPAHDYNIHPINSQDSGKITLVMQWNAPHDPVEFKEYYGLYNFSDLPKTPAITWTTGPQHNPFVPSAGPHQSFHLNLWYAVWTGTPPTTTETVTVTNFQYKHEVTR